jgi:hypothetical protein
VAPALAGALSCWVGILSCSGEALLAEKAFDQQHPVRAADGHVGIVEVVARVVHHAGTRAVTLSVSDVAAQADEFVGPGLKGVQQVFHDGSPYCGRGAQIGGLDQQSLGGRRREINDIDR